MSAALLAFMAPVGGFAPGPVREDRGVSAAASTDKAGGQPEAGQTGVSSQVRDRAKAYAKFPLSFEPNAGQTAPEVRFLARSPGATAFFTTSEVVLSLSRAEQPKQKSPATNQTAAGTARLQFLGANPEPQLTAGGMLRGVVNYFKGNDPALWRTNLPTFGEVSYKGLYPGVDLVYEGREAGLKGTYYVEPLSDPSQIRWRYEGARSVRVDRKGNLQIGLGSAEDGDLKGQKGLRLTEEKPVAWQDVDGRRRPVAARFKMFADGSVGFSLGRFDRRLPLVVDPTLSYSTYLGGSLYDAARDIAVDGDGNAYVVGSTRSPDFPSQKAIRNRPDCTETHTDGLFSDGQFPDCSDAFVTKINASGTELVYSTYLGSDDADHANAVSVDPSCAKDCAAFVAGDTKGDVGTTEDQSRFPTTNGAYDQNQDYPHPCSTNGSCNSLWTDVFIAKLSGDVSHAGSKPTLLYSTLVEPEEDPDLADTALDIVGYDDKNLADGDSSVAYVAGYTGSPAFPEKANFSEEDQKGVQDVFDPYDAFVLKMSMDNAQPSAGPSNGPEEPDPPEDPADLLFSTLLGGDGLVGEGDDPEHGEDVATGLEVTESNIYLTGYTKSPDFPGQRESAPPTQTRGDPGANHHNVFLAKLKAEEGGGYSLDYSTLFGGCWGDIAVDMTLDASGNAYIAGHTSSLHFLPEGDPEAGCGDELDNTKGFIAGITPTGFLFPPIFVDGGVKDLVGGVEVDSSGNIYVAGYTASAGDEFPTTEDAIQKERKGKTDAFLIKLSSDVLREQFGQDEIADEEITLSGDDQWLLYSTLLGGSGDEVGHTPVDRFFRASQQEYPPRLDIVDRDPSQSVYLAGATSSSDFPVEPKSDPVQASNGGRTMNERTPTRAEEEPCQELKSTQDALNSCDAFVAKIATVDVAENDQGTEAVETNTESAPSPSDPSPQPAPQPGGASGSGQESVSSSQSGTPAGTGSGSGGNRTAVSSTPAARGSLPDTGFAHGPALLALGLLLVAAGALMLRLAHPTYRS